MSGLNTVYYYGVKTFSIALAGNRSPATQLVNYQRHVKLFLPRQYCSEIRNQFSNLKSAAEMEKINLQLELEMVTQEKTNLLQEVKRLKHETEDLKMSLEKHTQVTVFFLKQRNWYKSKIALLNHVVEEHAVMRCLSVCLRVCLSVTFVSCVKTNKHIINNFSPSGSHAILVFFVPNGIAIFRQGFSTGASNTSVV